MERYIADRIIQNVHTAYNTYLAKIRTASASVRNHGISKAYMAMCEENGIVTPAFSWFGEAGAKFRTSGINNYFTKAYSLYKGNLYTEKLTNGNHEAGLCGTLTSGDEISTYTLNTVAPISGTQDAILAITTVGATFNRPRLSLTRNLPTDLPIRVTISYKVNSGACLYYGAYNGITYIGGQTLTGSGTITTPAFVYNSSTIWIAFANTSLFNVQIDNISIQEITANSADYDASQATSTSQPYLSGNIAPNERWGMKNPNVASNFMTHPTVTYASGDAWSLNFTMKCNNYSTTLIRGIISSIGGTYQIRMQDGGFVMLSPTISYRAITNSLAAYNGKTTHFTITHDTNGDLKVYINGVLHKTSAFISDFSLANILDGFGQGIDSSWHSLVTRLQVPTQSQVTAEYKFFRALYPEIESVVIGTQQWQSSNLEMAATPQGNLIPNVTDGTAWSNSTVLYDAAYAAQVGTVEQKTYAGVKAAAMWCYYNNDVALGATYGKLYNWYAAKLLQMDIDYYNTANPTTPWGWRVPTQVDFQTLSTYLGGDAVAGGKLKKEGLTYWNSPNTGADNSSGFTSLGGGQRDNVGVFANNLNQQFFRGSDGYRIYLLHNSAASTITTIDNLRGYSIRLIKV